MKSFLLILALGLASADKLDRTYLPPPGSKFSGGSDGALDVPLEFPKDTVSTTIRPTPGQQTYYSDDFQPTIGINRGTGPAGSQPHIPVTPAPKSPSFFQNNVPTTTTSYAFTQTTSYPSTAGFETTISPVGPVASVFPINVQQQYPGAGSPGQTDQQNQFVQPGASPGQPHQQNQFIQPGVGQFTTAPLGYNQPIYQNGTQYQQGVSNIPGIPSTISPITGAPIHPSQVPQSFGQQQISQFPGVQLPAQRIGQQGPFSTPSPVFQGYPQSFQPGSNYPSLPGTFVPGQQQFTGQQPSVPNVSQGLVPSTVGPYQPSYNQYGQVVPNIQQQIGSQRPLQPGSQGSLTSGQPQIVPTPGSQYPIATGQNSFFPSTTAPAVYQPGTSQYTSQGTLPSGGNIPQGNLIPGQQTHIVQGSPQSDIPQYSPQGIFPGTNIPQTGIPGQESQIIPGPSAQNIPGQQIQTIPGQGSPIIPGHGQLNIQPGYGQDQYQTPGLSQFPTTMRPNSFPSTSAPSFTGSRPIGKDSYPAPSFPSTSAPFPSNYPSLPSAGTTTSSIASSITPGYPGSQGQTDLVPSGLAQRPERPQAESDRNAEILNYENVITPEGYSYSFDTSNGIHADESGTATDGVKALGAYSYTGDDGKVYSVIYSADENGFLPRGDHLPTSPPIPEAIQRVIEMAKKNKEAGIIDDGSYDENKYGYEKYQPKDHRRPGSKGTVSNVDLSDEYDSIGNRKYRPRPGGRRPVTVSDENGNEYEVDNDDRGQQFVDEESNFPKQQTQRLPSRRPSDEIRPTHNGHDQGYDEYGNIVSVDEKGRPVGKIRPNDNQRQPARKPGTSKISGSLSYSGPDSEEDYYHTRPEGPSRVPTTTYRPVSAPTSFPATDSTEVAYQTKPKGRPMSSRKPIAPGSTAYPVVKDGDDLESSVDNGLPGLPHASTRLPGYTASRNQTVYTPTGRPQGPKHPVVETPESGYEDNVDDDLSYGGQQPGGKSGFTGRPGLKPTVHPSRMQDKYGKDRSQPQSIFPVPGQIDNKNSPGSGYSGQDDRHPYQQISSENQQPSQKPMKPGTGYQYIPPRNKFVPDEGKTFPTRFPDISQTTRRPTGFREKSGTSSVQPFITPNVSRDEEEDYEDAGVKRVPGKPKTQDKYDEYLKSEGESDYNEEKDQDIGDEITSPVRIRPGKPGITRPETNKRPTYTQSQPTTDKTYEYGDKYLPSGMRKRPGQAGGNKYYEQTTPLKPGQGYLDETSDAKAPGYTTTLRPSQAPMYELQPDGTYKQTTPSQYDETVNPTYTPDYRTPSSPGSVQRTGSRIPSRKPGDRTSTVVSSRPGSRLPADYPENDKDLGPELIRSGYSKTPFITTTPDYDRPSTPGSIRERIPSNTGEYYDRTVPSTSRPGSKFPSRPQDLPSTTYRPNYFTDKISQPDQTVVDAFGRPIPTAPGQYGPTNSRPGYSVTNAAPTTLYSEGSDVFNPNEPRFGTTDRPVGQDQTYIPTRGPYRETQPTTQRIIGEDFSGPKQQQRFDSKHGYYY